MGARQEDLSQPNLSDFKAPTFEELLQRSDVLAEPSLGGQDEIILREYRAGQERKRTLEEEAHKADLKAGERIVNF